MSSLLVWLTDFVFNVVAVGLLLRFLFRLFGANPSASFVTFLYESTNPLLAPFDNIFRPYVVEPGYVFEFSTLIAIVIYLIISALLVALLSFAHEQSMPSRGKRK